MHGIVKLAAASAALLLLAAPALAESRTVDLPAFTALDISSGIDAIVTVGGTQSITVEAKDKRLLDDLQLKVEGNTLKAYYDWSFFDIFSFGDREQIKLTITAPALKKIEASAGSDVVAAGVTGDTLEFGASSGADLSLSGVVGKLVELDASSGAGLKIEGSCVDGKANASSGSDLDAEDLLCATMDANASSGSDLEVYASKSIKANASSGSDLSIYGNPAEVDQEASSGSDIKIEN
ncbi:hypothetical protein VW23_027160 [Devosia insulae DS-56]|uniref:Putative auto-transporter adhesin head GIN domain-containing protein n=1 Tax=Devosia insulae DS-56 TaxID=1116389 RepID=A0A1E5XKK8_9HYPH|nr:head GIN domain-containing protein [Devosia insulae]OEO29034.1 hypothetical protein VW23_027160 [Devosia insulae DS-56]